MPEISQLVSDVKVEGNFDVTDAQALRWLTLRHELMCSRSRCYRKVSVIGTTVAGQQAYPLPATVVDVTEVVIDGMRYGKMRHSDISDANGGFLVLLGDGGVWTGDEDSAGLELVALYPIPDTAGLNIQVRGAYLPPALDTADDTTLKIPADFREQLVSGAIAIGLDRTEQRPDLATTMEGRFSQGCEELRLRVLKKLRGQGPSEIRTDFT